MSEWIKVSDRLPTETEGSYLVAFRDEKYPGFKGTNEIIWYVTEGAYYSNDNVWYTGGEINRLITHWMPFPNPPEERDDNQT